MRPASKIIDTGYRPHRHQLEIHQSLKRFSVLVCHRRFGKTVLAINAAIDAALRCTLQDGRYAYVCPYQKQAKDVAWLYLTRFASPVPGVKIGEQDLSVTFPNGARVKLYGSDNADALRGLYLDGFVGDEYADWRPGVWEAIVRPTLTDRSGWALFIGTPKGVNAFYELYRRALADPAWFTAIYRADQTNIIKPEELAAAKAAMSDRMFRQEFLCDWNASADDILITIDEVVAASERRYTERDVEFAPRVLGVDVARFGDDSSVIQRRQGLQAFDPLGLHGIDNMELAARVSNEIQLWEPQVVFIDAGRGEGVIDRLRQLGHQNIIEVNFGGKASNPHYANKKSEIWCEMRDWIRNGGAVPAHQRMMQDLSTPKYSFNSAGRLVLESKDDIKERGMPSPDYADALALTFALPVMPPDRLTRNIAADYNPFDAL